MLKTSVNFSFNKANKILVLSHPMLTMLIGFMSGIIFEFTTQYTCIIFMLFLSLLLIYYKKKFEFLPLLFLLFFIGYVRTRSSYPISISPGLYSNITGNVINVASSCHKYFPIVFDLATIIQNQKVILRIYYKKREVSISETIFLPSIRISRQRKNDVRLLRDKVNSVLYYTGNIVKQIDQPANSLSSIKMMRENIYNQLKTKMPLATFSFFSPLFLGHYEKSENQHAREWGLMHVFARSGLHLAIILFLLNTFLRIIPLYIWLKRFITISFITIYITLTWLSISFIRALSMYLLHQAFYFAKNRVEMMHILYLTTFMMLFYNPFYLFCLDFQLSFSLTYILILIYRVINYSE